MLFLNYYDGIILVKNLKIQFQHRIKESGDRKLCLLASDEFPTRDQTRAYCSKNMSFKGSNCQGIPRIKRILEESPVAQ